jgi:hypothetical protein
MENTEILANVEKIENPVDILYQGSIQYIVIPSRFDIYIKEAREILTRRFCEKACSLGFTSFCYLRQNMKTRQNEINTVFCKDALEFFKLMNFWNCSEREHKYYS